MRAATRGAVLGAVVLLLGGCGLIIGDDPRSWTMPVTNRTTHDLTIRLGGSRLADVPAGDRGEVPVAPRGECVNAGGSLNAVTDDGLMVAALDASPEGEVCEGDTWAIEQSDLVPIEDTIYAPSS